MHLVIVLSFLWFMNPHGEELDQGSAVKNDTGMPAKS